MYTLVVVLFVVVQEIDTSIEYEKNEKVHILNRTKKFFLYFHIFCLNFLMSTEDNSCRGIVVFYFFFGVFCLGFGVSEGYYRNLYYGLIEKCHYLLDFIIYSCCEYLLSALTLIIIMCTHKCFDSHKHIYL